MSSLRILMYCHDRLGLSHAMRTMTVASHLAEHLADCSILVLTDLSIIGRFKFPQNVDYVHLPGIANKSKSSQYAGSLNIELEETLSIRRKIIKSAAKTFQPDFFIVERDPFGPHDEIQRILSSMREHLPKTKIIWGLSDVIGDPEMVRREWSRDDFYRMLEQYCDEIWVYGEQGIFDQISNYQIPAAVASKYYHIGYLKPPHAAVNAAHKDIIKLHQNKKPYLLVTAGSGAEGFKLIDSYLRTVERAGEALPYQSLIVTGPMMRTRDKVVLKERAEKLPGVIFHRFSKHVLQYVKHAHLVVSTGGYNTLCEILSYRKKAIFAPALKPPQEHMLRSEIFQKLGLVKRLHPKELTADRLAEVIEAGLFGSHELTVHPADRKVPLEGLAKIVERIEFLGGLKFQPLRKAV